MPDSKISLSRLVACSQSYQLRAARQHGANGCSVMVGQDTCMGKPQWGTGNLPSHWIGYTAHFALFVISPYAWPKTSKM
jgi:hypothetical protein